MTPKQIPMKTIKQGLLAWIKMPFMWSKWIDITTFSFASAGYLLQGRVNSVSNAKQFRITIMKQRFAMADPPKIELDKLQSLGL